MNAMLRGALAGIALLPVGTAIGAEKKVEVATFGVSIEASTLGAGLSVGLPVGERFNVRGVYHAYTYDLDDIEDDETGATYQPELDLKSAGVMVDFHPFKGAFRITAGLASNGNQINLAAIANAGSTYEVGACTFESDPSDPLRLDGTVEFASSAPYLGVGWGGNMHSEPGFFATFDVGVLLSGSPDSNLRGSGSARNASANPATFPQCGNGGPLAPYQDVSGYPEFQAAVQEAEGEVNDETEDYEYWPNVALGIGWRF
jgi:hypothetical protein